MAGERLNLSNPPPPSRSATNTERTYLGVRFHCCQIYQRIYRNRQQTAYEGRCPRCGKPVRVRIGTGGVAARFFEVH
jgi:hypothetical protein